MPASVPNVKFNPKSTASASQGFVREILNCALITAPKACNAPATMMKGVIKIGVMRLLRLFAVRGVQPPNSKRDGQQRQWRSDFEVGSEAEDHAFRACTLRYDEIGDGSNQSEIAGERRRHGYDEPSPLRIGRVGEERLQQQNRRDIADQIG